MQRRSGTGGSEPKLEALTLAPRERHLAPHCFYLAENRRAAAQDRPMVLLGLAPTEVNDGLHDHADRLGRRSIRRRRAHVGAIRCVGRFRRRAQARSRVPARSLAGPTHVGHDAFEGRPIDSVLRGQGNHNRDGIVEA